MKPIVYSISLGVVAFAPMPGCAAANVKPSEQHASDTDIIVQPAFGASAILPKAELENTIKLAEAGDPVAAYRLFAHYSIGVGDGETGQKYFDQAVTLGYPPALYAKAVQLWDSGKADVEEAYALVKRAIELGQPDTAQFLPELEKALAARQRKQMPGAK